MAERAQRPRRRTGGEGGRRHPTRLPARLHVLDVLNDQDGGVPPQVIVTDTSTRRRTRTSCSACSRSLVGRTRLSSPTCRTRRRGSRHADCGPLTTAARGRWVRCARAMSFACCGAAGDQPARRRLGPLRPHPQALPRAAAGQRSRLSPADQRAGEPSRRARTSRPLPRPEPRLDVRRALQSCSGPSGPRGHDVLIGHNLDCRRTA